MILNFVARVRSLLRDTLGDADADMRAEFAHHLELRARDLVHAGLSPDEAARRARVEFGGTYNYLQAGREARGLRWFDFLRISWLDVKLGARMIRRYPGLTVVASVAMGIAIALGAGVLSAIALMKDPKIPLDEGDRIVGIQVWSTWNNNPERRIAYDFATWKSGLRTVRDVGVFRNATRAVGAPDGRAEPARGAEMSASGFRVARVPPLLGRYLLDDDERPGAPRVVVLGHEMWRARFGADSSIVGRSVMIGGVTHTVVGVMPEGFAWPVNFSLWLPLRIDPLAYEPREGPVLYAFGRLAAGASLDEARAELATLGERIAQMSPKTHQGLRARLLPFSQSWFELDSPDTVLAYRAAQAAVTLLLMIICVNIAILVYARTATRQGEIVVRSALGASRSRIVAQLVGEALVLAALGAAIGLSLISIIAGQMDNILVQTGADAVVPFWMKLAISPETLGYLVALAVLAALIIGVVPALQVTGRRVQASLQRLSGGRASIRMGRLWTSLVIVEVAFTVSILPTAVFFAYRSIEAMMTGPGFPAEQYLSAELTMDRESFDSAASGPGKTFSQHFLPFREEVMRRLAAQPRVAGVTYTAEALGSESSTQVEVEGFPVTKEERAGAGTYSVRWHGALRVRWASVGAEFFDVFGARPIAGRTFVASDGSSGANVAVVNRAFVETIMKGRNPVGLKLRSLEIDASGPGSGGPWQEIVGVVENIPAKVDYERPEAVWYEPVRAVHPARLQIHVRGGDPVTFSSRLRAITADVHPALFFRTVEPLSDVLWESHLPLRLMTTTLIAVAFSVLVLSAAGLYALMTVIVTSRRREIGIRIALGADRRRVLSGIFSRAAMQVGAGIALGMAIAGVALRIGGGELKGFNAFVVLPAVSLFMLAVGALAALGPARRGLAIQPSTVLKED